MNPSFAILVILGLVVLWFLLSFAFVPIGTIIYRVIKDAFDEMSKGNIEEKEND